MASKRAKTSSAILVVTSRDMRQVVDAEGQREREREMDRERRERQADEGDRKGAVENEEEQKSERDM